MAEGTGLVYGSVTGGHRLSYAELLSHELGLTIFAEQPSIAALWKLGRAERLLFSTLDDHLGFFIVVTLLRSLTGRKTSTLPASPIMSGNMAQLLSHQEDTLCGLETH